MAEGTGGVTEITRGGAARSAADRGRDRAPAAGAHHARGRELSRRGHELTDVGLQVRRHALGVDATVLAMGAVAAGSIALGVWRARRRETLAARGGRLREALGRMIDRPERVAVEPTATQRILGAAGSAAAAFLIKAALERASRPRDPAR